MELTQEARAARALRDELDILRERANKVHLLETELQSYKDKMSQMESLKCRIDEVRDENKILVETKEMLEEQLETSRKRYSIFNKLWYLIQSTITSFDLCGYDGFSCFFFLFQVFVSVKILLQMNLRAPILPTK